MGSRSTGAGARISWPNGVAQLDRMRYDVRCDQTLRHPDYPELPHGLSRTNPGRKMAYAPQDLSVRNNSEGPGAHRPRCRMPADERIPGMFFSLVVIAGVRRERPLVDRQDLHAVDWTHRSGPAPLHDHRCALTERLITRRRPGVVTFRSTFLSCPSWRPFSLLLLPRVPASSAAASWSVSSWTPE